jgi:GNAT superfamily N-acetyltransferase
MKEEKAMLKMRFVQIEKNNEEHFELFKSLMVPYNSEQDSHRPYKEPLSTETIIEYTRGMMNMQGPFDRHLELCFDGEKLIGFYYAKVDHIGHKGFIKPEYGYIMEFYVLPEHRRKGCGKLMFNRLESLFANHNIKRMYLTSDPITGEPFWKSLGFEDTGEISPENNLKIFEKDVISNIESNHKEPFDNLIINDNEIMVEKTMNLMFSAKPLTEEVLMCISCFMSEEDTLNALHEERISYKQWKEVYKLWLAKPYEKIFVLYFGSIAVGWMKLNGFEKQDMAWISVLVVGSKFRRMGAGIFAVKFAEEYIKNNGINKVGIHTTKDNVRAQKLYLKCGYTITNKYPCTTPDGKENVHYTFEKELITL